MISAPLLAASVVALGVAPCAAFVPPAARRSLSRPLLPPKQVTPRLMAEGEGGSGGLESILSSLPDIKDNVMEGKLGERGEPYVIAQFSLFFFIAVGTIPVIGEPLVSILGPALIVGGLYLVYRSAADLGNNLSPWPVPADPQSGRGSLINDGIYAFVRHPMYAGALCGMAGLSLITDSVTRLLLTVALFFVLDAKSGYEETKLVEAYGEEYTAYQREVPGKFFPPNSSKHDVSIK